MKTTHQGMTIIELLIVLAILGLLATIAYSVYTGHVYRAQIVATQTEIHTIELACAQYESDTGQYPVSSSGNLLGTAGVIDPSNVPGEGAVGCGYMITCLKTSLSGDPYNPSDPNWQGPYIEFEPKRYGTLTGEPLDPTVTYPLPLIQLLDTWRTPYYYVRSVDYESFLGTELPVGSPFASERWYNPSTVQIVSFGPDKSSNGRPQLGTGPDDLTNFRY